MLKYKFNDCNNINKSKYFEKNNAKSTFLTKKKKTQLNLQDLTLKSV